MSLIYDYDVEVLKKMNKALHSEALELYIQIRVGACMDKMWMTSVTSTSIISILLSFYFFTVSFSTHDTVTLVLRMITLLFLLICNVFFMKMHLKANRNLSSAIDAFQEDKRKEMAYLMERYANIHFEI